MKSSLPVINLSEAKFECIYGRGCDGICCQNGRPGVYPDEEERLEANLHKFLPELRPDARRVVEADGHMSRRRKGGLPMLRVVDGWCVFFHNGCVLHKVGAMEGDKYRYKPAACALFPLARNEKDEWYIRQKGVEDEAWDLFCLNPNATTPRAADNLQEEMRLAERYMAEEALQSEERAAG
jgi:Fe-S-cluster containining protein